MRLHQRSLALGVAMCLHAAAAQTVTVSVTPSADAFVRSTAPASNYGGAGALSVSGSAAVNGNGIQNGVFDTLIRFPMSNVVATLNASLGVNDWIIRAVSLRVEELGAPANALFNRGIGGFEIEWLPNDNWSEGTGTPNAPTTDGVAYQDLAALLNGTASLGVYTNRGSDGPISLALGLSAGLLSDIRSGAEAGLHLKAAGASVGFTFDSRNFGTITARPNLDIVAAANPHVRFNSIVVGGGVVELTFNTASNWAYHLQRAEELNGGDGLIWSNLAHFPAQETNGAVLYQDAKSAPQRFYRLELIP